jgi:hypothetical protein
MKRALEVLHQLVADGVIRDYAIGGAMGATFYLEPVVTMDLDVFVLFQDNASLVPLQPIYDALRERGYFPDEIMPECIDIDGTPVQFLPVYNNLLEEALKHAVEFDYDGVLTRVLPAEYLAAISVQTGRAKDKLRVQAFLGWEGFDRKRFAEICAVHGLNCQKEGL